FLLGGRIVTTASRTVRAGPADGPPEVMPRYLSGRSWDPLVISLFFLFSSGARAPAPSSPLTSISLLRPPNLDSLRGNLPRHLLHLPKPLNRLLTAGIIPRHRRLPLEVLEALLHVDPLLRSSSARTDRGNGFVVSSMCSPVFSTFRGVSPAPVNSRRRRRRTCCRLRRGSKVMHRGRSAWEVRTV